MQFRELDHSPEVSVTTNSLQSSLSNSDYQQFRESQKQTREKFDLPNLVIEDSQKQEPISITALDDTQLKSIRDGISSWEMSNAWYISTKDKGSPEFQTTHLCAELNKSLKDCPSQVTFDKMTVDLPLKPEQLKYVDIKDGVSQLMLKVERTDGTVGYVELSQLSRSADRELHTRYHDKLFTSADRNNDGKIDAEEYRKDLDVAIDWLKERWKKDGNPPDVVKQNTTESLANAQKAFKRMAGTDNEITKEEYKKAAVLDKYWISAANQIPE